MSEFSFTKALNFISDTYFNWHAIISFIICIVAALLLGRFIAYILRLIVRRISAEADKSSDLLTVNRLRRTETIMILISASQRVILVIIALYVWWLLDHPDTPPTALIGASAVLLLILSASVSPMIRDVASGTAMMIEHWYGVGDHIKIEPFANMQGVVERVTLRSTRIRNINGEVIWVNNQNIQGVRLTPKGIRTIALELFVTDLKRGQELIEEANDRLPIGPLLLLRPLVVREEVKVGKNLWHITAVGETAPEREWLLETAAVNLIKELDEESEKPVIEHGPLFRYADSDAEKKFKRTISNARKNPKTRKFEPIKLPSSLVIVKENQHPRQSSEFSVPGRNNKTQGFTIVELVVVIVVIAILAAISVLGVNAYLKQSRDTIRASSVQTLAESLEKYYDANGEYPSCNALQQAPATISSTTLKGIDTSVFKTPQTNSPDNALVCDIPAANSADNYIYLGDSSGKCVGGVACLGWTLSYRSEADGSLVAIKSRRGTGGAGSKDQYGLACREAKPVATFGNKEAGGKPYITTNGTVYTKMYFMSGSSANYTGLPRWDGTNGSIADNGANRWKIFGTYDTAVFALNSLGTELWKYDNGTATKLATAPIKWNDASITDNGTIYLSGDAAAASYYNRLWRYKNGAMQEVATTGLWYNVRAAGDDLVYGASSNGATLYKYSNGVVTTASTTNAEWMRGVTVGSDMYSAPYTSGTASTTLSKYNAATNTTTAVATTGDWNNLTVSGTSIYAIGATGVWRFDTATGSVVNLSSTYVYGASGYSIDAIDRYGNLYLTRNGGDRELFFYEARTSTWSALPNSKLPGYDYIYSQVSPSGDYVIRVYGNSSGSTAPSYIGIYRTCNY